MNTMPRAEPAFAIADWIVLSGYLTVVVLLGVLVSRQKQAGDEFFLAGRRMPMWAVSISVLATSLSAATFIGGPQQAFSTDLTYFSANLGGLIAVMIVAVLFVPAYYRHNVTSVYELLDHRFGGSARTAASGMFMLGRIFASGARLFMVALPFALIAFGDISQKSLITSILIIAVAATAYTSIGGIRAVIWTDVLQTVVVVGAVVIALCLLLRAIPLSASEIVDVLRRDAGGDKLKIIDLSTDPSRKYTLWTAIFGVSLLNLAAFGADQDLTQRMLTCRSAKAGAWSVILSNILAWPVVFLFLCMGLLLYVYYQRPDVMGGAAPEYVIDDSRKVFLEFMLTEMPAGVRGLMMAGLFAAAMSSMDSALNAMASTTVADFYRPWRKRNHAAYIKGDRRELVVSRFAIVVWAMTLALFAIICVFWQKASGQTLISFALSVMTFAYAGLLGVFLTALLTQRGSERSALASLAVGFIAVLLMQDFLWTRWMPALGIDLTLAFPWKLLIATLLSFAVCCLGTRNGASSQ